MKNLKNLFEAYERAEMASTEIENRWDADPENEELEKAFDVAYELEHKALMKLAEGIKDFTGGKIDIKTARIMIMKKMPELKALMNRIA